MEMLRRLNLMLWAIAPTQEKNVKPFDAGMRSRRRRYLIGMGMDEPTIAKAIGLNIEPLRHLPG